MEDEDFEWEVFCRWEELRHGILSNEYLESFIDNTVEYLGSAVDRNFDRFPILGVYVWPNREWPPTYAQEIENMKNWIEGRLEWVDGEWGGICEYVGKDEVIEKSEPELGVRIRPNPTNLENTYLDIRTEYPLIKPGFEIIDLNGRLMSSHPISPSHSNYLVWKLPDLSRLNTGVYFIRITDGNKLIQTEKLIKIEK